MGETNQPDDAFLRSVLRWSLQQQDTEGSAGVEPMPEERQAWLKEALASMRSAPSDVDVMKQELQRLSTPAANCTDAERQDLLRRKEEALETLIDLCGGIDNARDMIPLGGYPVIKSLLQSTEDTLVWRTSELVATLAQNNPVCQMAIVESGLVSILLRLLRESDSEAVRVKSLYAISCAVKDHVEAHEAFVVQQGYSVLVSCLSSDVEKLLVKAVFLMGNLCQSHSEAGNFLCEAGVVESLASFLKGEHAAWHEHATRTLLALATEHEGCKERCRQPELGLEKAVRSRLEFLLRHCGEETQEERDFCKQLLLFFR